MYICIYIIIYTVYSETCIKQTPLRPALLGVRLIDGVRLVLNNHFE